MSKERESTFGEFNYPTLAVNIYCPECNVPDVFYSPKTIIQNKKHQTHFDFQCHSCKHEWTTVVEHPVEKKKK